MTTNNKDIRIGDYVRVTYNRMWPGQAKSNTADMIDWGFIVKGIDKAILHSPQSDTIRLVSHAPFTIIVAITRDWLEKILVELHPKRTFEIVNSMRQMSDVVWKVKSDRDEVVLLVYNPRMEHDEEGWSAVWDKVTKEDGSDLTDEEEDTYFDDLRESIRSNFNS